MFLLQPIFDYFCVSLRVAICLIYQALLEPYVVNHDFDCIIRYLALRQKLRMEFKSASISSDLLICLLDRKISLAKFTLFLRGELLRGLRFQTPIISLPTGYRLTFLFEKAKLNSMNMGVVNMGLLLFKILIWAYWVL